MRLLSLSGAALAVIGVFVATASSDASGAASHRGIAGARVAPRVRGAGRPVVRAGATPVPCTTNFPGRSSTAISGAGDVAGGDSSGISAGNVSEACDLDDAVTGGEENLVGHNPQGEAGDAAYSTIGGGQNNAITAAFSYDGAGVSNLVFDSASFVGAGEQNVVNGAGADSFIGAGYDNDASGTAAMIGSGENNSSVGDFSAVVAGVNALTVGDGSFVGAGGTEYQTKCSCTTTSSRTDGRDAFIGAGDQNYAEGNASFVGAGGYTYDSNGAQMSYGNQALGDDSFLGAGDQNTAGALESFVGGGLLNDVTSAATDAAIVGGNNNYASGVYATVGGGSGNKVEGAFSTIPGGADNQALGNASFAAGYHAKASHSGSFVWSDDVSGSGYATDGNTNEFIVRASGGTYVFSNEGESVGVKLAAGSGAWASTSDRNEKTDIARLDDASILEKVSELPISAWQYKTERGVRHVGPMAQDFYAAFGVGEDNRHITSIDEDGVALAAIKALHAENARLRRKNARVEARLSTIEAKDARLERRFDALVSRLRVEVR